MYVEVIEESCSNAKIAMCVELQSEERLRS